MANGKRPDGEFGFSGIDGKPRVVFTDRGNVPRWAVMARAMSLRKKGIELKSLTGPIPVGSRSSREEQMDVFRFAKLPMQANDPTRRYRLIRSQEADDVGGVEIGGDAPEGDEVRLAVDCSAILADAARDDALATTRRFLAELVAGWGIQVAEVGGGLGWRSLSDGTMCIQLDFRVVCATP